MKVLQVDWTNLHCYRPHHTVRLALISSPWDSESASIAHIHRAEFIKSVTPFGVCCRRPPQPLLLLMAIIRSISFGSDNDRRIAMYCTVYGVVQ